VPNRRPLSSFGALALFLAASPAWASFHLMKVEQAMGGVNGDMSQQVVQLRMRFGGQNFVGSAQSRLIARDAAGLNPITLIVFPSDVANGAQGARILVVSSAFAAAHPGIADFTMTAVIPPAYLAAGRLTFEDSVGTIYWSLAWGGASYTGSNLGSTTNDADGNFGPPFAGALPSATAQALRFSASDATGAALSTTNAADYSVGAAVLINNVGTSTSFADLSIMKDDGRTSASPLQSITYTIVASNAGPAAVTGATVMDTPPSGLTGVTWTCVASAGSSCGAPSGNTTINDTVNLLVGGTVTYTMSGTVALAPGSLRNTATVNPPGGVADPDLANNSATDDDLLLCGDVVVVPDGRVSDFTLNAIAVLPFGASLKIGNSYSVEFKNKSGDSTPPGTLMMFSGDDGCGGTSTITTRNTAAVDPASGSASYRVSFTAAGVEPFFRARLSGSPSTVPITVTWSDTTMFSPAWSTNGSFDTYYSFQNTTGATLNGTLTLFDTGGAVVSTSNLVVPAGQTVATNTVALSSARNHTGTARFTHDGPPGAFVAEAAIANFSINPAYVQPVKFQAVREAR
jgi:uncharacterized repeat protein (TIGR01451 family)